MSKVNMAEFDLPPLSHQDRLTIFALLPQNFEPFVIEPEGIFKTQSGVTFFLPTMMNFRQEGVLAKATRLSDYELAGLYLYRQEDVEWMTMPSHIARVFWDEMRLVKTYQPNCKIGMLDYILASGEGLEDEMEFERYAQGEFIGLSEQDIRLKVDPDYNLSFHSSRVTTIVLESTPLQLQSGQPYDKRNFIVLDEYKQQVPITELKFVPKTLRHLASDEPAPSPFDRFYSLVRRLPPFSLSEM